MRIANIDTKTTFHTYMHKKTENVTRRYKTKNEESPIHYFCYTWSLNNNHTDDR